MPRKRRSFDARYKARVALEAIREEKTLAEIASVYGVHPQRIAAWKKEALSRMAEIFQDGKAGSAKDQDELISALYEQIGKLKVELDWLKKNLACPYEERRRWIGKSNGISIQRQCELAGLSRSGHYYRPAGESALNLELMRRIDEQYTRTPFYGSRRMTVCLRGLGLRGEPQAGAAADAVDGHRGGLPQAAAVGQRRGTQGFSVPAVKGRELLRSWWTSSFTIPSPGLRGYVTHV